LTRADLVASRPGVKKFKSFSNPREKSRNAEINSIKSGLPLLDLLPRHRNEKPPKKAIFKATQNMYFMAADMNLNAPHQVAEKIGGNKRDLSNSLVNRNKIRIRLPKAADIKKRASSLDEIETDKPQQQESALHIYSNTGDSN
jgi:hypothetical protein